MQQYLHGLGEIFCPAKIFGYTVPNFLIHLAIPYQEYISRKSMQLACRILLAFLHVDITMRYQIVGVKQDTNDTDRVLLQLYVITVVCLYTIVYTATQLYHH